MAIKETGRLPFTVLAIGQFGPSQLNARHVDTPRATTDEIERQIAEEWTRQTALAAAADRESAVVREFQARE